MNNKDHLVGQLTTITPARHGKDDSHIKVVDESAPEMQGMLSRNGDALMQVSCFSFMCLFRVMKYHMFVHTGCN